MVGCWVVRMVDLSAALMDRTKVARWADWKGRLTVARKAGLWAVMMAGQKAVRMAACSVDQMVGLMAASMAVLTAALRECLKGRLKADYWDGL